MSSSEEKLAKQFEEFHKLAQADKKIDVAGLMINSLQSHEKNSLPDKSKRWAYLISIGLPPFGLIFAAKFYYSGKDDGEETALICVFLTVLSIFLFLLLGKVLLSSAGTSVNQIYNIKPSDIQQLIQ